MCVCLSPPGAIGAHWCDSGATLSIAPISVVLLGTQPNAPRPSCFRIEPDHAVDHHPVQRPPPGKSSVAGVVQLPLQLQKPHHAAALCKRPSDPLLEVRLGILGLERVEP